MLDLANPFPGLRCFLSEEDYLFFGRHEQIEDLLRRLRTNRLVAVVGTSGSGKSSLVRAGLLPAVLGGGMSQAGSAWEIAVMRPGGSPMAHLARALCEAGLYDVDAEDALFHLQATLSRSRNGLIEAVRQSPVSGGPEASSKLLLVVDQFEELFRFNRASATSQEEAIAFVNLLLHATQQADQNVYVVLTMRSDFLGECSQFLGLAEAVNDGEFLIPRMTRDQIQEAIEGPIRVRGAEIAPRLLFRLLNDVQDNQDQLPVLQHALMRTWDLWQRSSQAGAAVLDLEHYEATGGMQEALSRHADEIFEAFPSDLHRNAAARIFKALTERGPDGRGIRRPTRVGQLVAISSAAQPIVHQVIEAYRAPGITFLMPPAPSPLDDAAVIDLSHESLMRVWRRLRGWVEEEAQSARIYRRLHESADLHAEKRAGLYHDPDLQIGISWREVSAPNAAWASQYGGGFDQAMAFLDASREAAERAEKEREADRQRELERARQLAESQVRVARLFKRFAGGLAVAFCFAVALTVWALMQGQEAVRQEAFANDQRRIAEESARIAEESARKAEAYGLVHLVVNVDTPNVPPQISQLTADRRHWANPYLRELFTGARESSPQKLHASLALLPVDPDQVDYLIGRLLDADPKDALPVIRDALAPHKQRLLNKLWATAEHPQKGSQRLRAAAALVEYDPKNERWANIQDGVINDLLAVNQLNDSFAWKELFRPVRFKLQDSLAAKYRSLNRLGEAYPATNILADFAADQPHLLADLLMDADDEQFRVIYPKCKELGDTFLANEFSKEVPSARPAMSDWTVRFHQWEKRAINALPDWEAVLRSPVLDERKVPRLDFVDENQPPMPPTPKVPGQYFALVATAEVTLGDGPYVIRAKSDDGVRVWLDDRLVINDWSFHQPRTMLGSVVNKRGKHLIKVEFFQGAGGYVLEVDFNDSETPNDMLAKRKANAATALLKMNRPTLVWPLLKQSPDPRTRSFLIDRLGKFGADAKALVQQMDKESDVSVRRALLLSLGQFNEKQFTPEERKAFLPKLQDIYRNAADPGLHAASEWLLRKWDESAWIAKIYQAWAADTKQQLTKLEVIKEELTKEKNKEERRWYVNGQGQTLVVIPGPVDFWMGSSPAEARMGSTGDLRQWRHIGRSFAVASKEVTVDQFLRFRKDQPVMRQWAPTGDYPVNNVSWYDAAAYCNWLSKEEGIPEDQWCYEPNKAGKGTYDQGMKMAPNYLQRTGYRLPTEAEWEFACRAGAVTRFSFGESEEMLPAYGLYANNSQFRPRPVGTLKPNDFGFFDMHGNVNEWCQDVYAPYGKDGDRKTTEELEEISPINNPVTRGGSFDTIAQNLRSAWRGSYSFRAARFFNLGFRPARTLLFSSFDRYDAAKAALVAAGQRKEPPLDDTAAKLRRRALDLLKAEMADWAKVQPPPRQFIVRNLRQWQQGAELAGIRDNAALAKLPAEERKAYTLFWAGVANTGAPANNAERVLAATAAYDDKKFVYAAGLWTEALTSDPKLGREHRYNAARAAILAAAGQDADVPPLDKAAKEKLRAQALAWLTTELAVSSKLLESGPIEDRSAIVQALSNWQMDSNLASIREATPLAKLPADEKKAWQALWARMPVLTYVPTSKEEGQKWRYTTTQPVDSWQKADFDDKHWQEGLGPFGSSAQYAFRTEWKTDDIWLRREFTMPQGNGDDLLLLVNHDDDAEIYVNGILALKAPGFGWAVQLPLSAEARKALRPGKNVFAVHCRNRDGPQYIDVGIVAVRGNSARLYLARPAYDRKHFAFATQIWAAALADDPKIAADPRNYHRYNAACSAAMAAAGQGYDAPLDRAAEAKLRRLALDSLRGDLAECDTLLASGTPQDRTFVVQTLSHWQNDSDLVGIRDPGPLATLPPDEQKAFTQLWTDVGTLFTKAAIAQFGKGIDISLTDGKVNVDGILSNEDPKDTVRKQSARKVYNIKLSAGYTYKIDMSSKAVDSYLRLEDATGKQLAEDDDSGGFQNARIVFPCPADGAYRIIATNFGPQPGANLGLTGAFTLSVTEQLTTHQTIPWFVAQQGLQGHLWQTKISSDGRLLTATGDTGPKGAIRVWELATGKQIQELVPGGELWYHSAEFLPGRKQLVAGYRDSKDLYLWDLESGKLLRKFAGHDQPGPHFILSPDSKRLLSWSDDKTVRLWDVDTGKELRKLVGDTDMTAGVFSPDSTQILTTGPDKTLRLWDAKSGKELLVLKGHTEPARVSFSPDGKQALSYALDQTIRLWDLKTGEEIRQFGNTLFGVDYAEFVARGQRIVASTADRKIGVWETATGKLVREIDCSNLEKGTLIVTASPDGRLAMVASEGWPSVLVFDLSTGKEIQRYDNCRAVRCLSISPDSTRAAAGSFRQGVIVFRLPPLAKQP